MCGEFIDRFRSNMKPVYFSFFINFLTMIHNRFKSGKHQGKTYLEIWQTDRTYLYWMASNFTGNYWSDIVRIFEERDKQMAPKPIKQKFPSVEEVRQIFKLNPICGFDMSDYICDLYQSLPDG